MDDVVVLGPTDLGELLALYRHLHRDDAALSDGVADDAWRQIQAMPGHSVLGCRDGHRLVASCVLQVVPNLTRGARPYGLIENVVTHTDFRRQGLGRHVIGAALDRAWAADCYKVMLLSGVSNTGAHQFYTELGLDPLAKQGFVATPPGNP